MRDADGEVLNLSNGNEARYFLPVGAILSVENGAAVKAGDVVARIPRESSKTRDITGGLPRVAELFEARRPKDFAVISETDGRVEFGTDYKAKRRIRVVPSDDSIEPVEYLLPKGRSLAVNEGDTVRKGICCDGSPVPRILNILGWRRVTIWSRLGCICYRASKSTISILRRLCVRCCRKLKLTMEVDTLLVGEQVEREEFIKVNEAAEAEGLALAKARPVLLGITKASLQTRSFVSAASFQETTRVLTEASVSGREDRLEGLKENVIVGRLIPAGTGSVVNRLRAIASDRDKSIALKRAEAESQPAELTTEIGFEDSEVSELSAE